MGDLIKQCERNVINQTKLLQETITYIDALRTASYKIFDANRRTDENCVKFQEGLSLMRQAVYAKHCESVSRCFDIIGVGGKEALEFCKKETKERFEKNEICLIEFLNKHGHVSALDISDVPKLKEEIRENLKD